MLYVRCDIVVDVGGEFDVAKKRFDHHQRSFNHTFATLVPEKTSWNIKLSSAGLVYVHYGKQVIEQIIRKITKNETVDQKLVDIIYEKMYENFVKEIDAIDNGIEIAETKAYSINTNLSARVSFFNPDWNETDKNETTQFHLALEMVGSEFTARIKYYALNWYPAREIVLKAIVNRFKVDPSK